MKHKKKKKNAMALAGYHGARADGASRGVDGARNASAVVMAQPHQPR
nr:hypothetical protein [Tanacetum cinerariifolium]